MVGAGSSSSVSAASVKDVKDLRSAAAALRSGSTSARFLTTLCLERIGRLDARLNSFITVTTDAALSAADAADAEIKGGRLRGPLHGIPIALKDNIDTAGVLTTAASNLFRDRMPSQDAEVVTKLKESGAVILGKLNMHELALGTTSAISAFGPVRNPWDLLRSAGGSSGGAGAAVAAGLCYAAVGTDTGGSIRIPASACGIVGLKPTFGIVSAVGTVPLSQSFDHVGPMARTVADTALMFAAMTDHPIARACALDKLPPTSSLRIGVARNLAALCDSTVSTEVQAVFDTAVDVIRPLVRTIDVVDVPSPDELGGIIEWEAHARFAPLIRTTRGGVHALTKELVEKTPLQAAYQQMMAALAVYRATTPKFFRDVDLVLLPTLPLPPIALVAATQPFSVDSCTFAFSIGGWPCISVPCGFSRDGLPVGMLIGGAALAEPRIFALARAYEAATSWHLRRPSIAD